ncbi:MAG TPA: hypothetical protein PLH25_01220 [Flavobacterium sp.]|nr:hypothetical protein [Flavobacterium sp.]HQW68259.1 hypothetical protein [Flavobacterium sp.]
MINTSYNYSLHYKSNSADEKIVVLTQARNNKGEENSLEIPESDLSNLITKLSNFKEIVDTPIIPIPDMDEVKIEPLRPNVIQTLVALFLSGIPVTDLSRQYNYPEEIIKFHLEEKGIILLD